jgi:hypothetical protein
VAFFGVAKVLTLGVEPAIESGEDAMRCSLDLPSVRGGKVVGEKGGDCRLRGLGGIGSRADAVGDDGDGALARSERPRRDMDREGVFVARFCSLFRGEGVAGLAGTNNGRLV